MTEYNKLPEDSMIIDNFNDFNDFFCFAIQEVEFRQPFYNNEDFCKSLYDLNILWIDKNKGLGYGFAKDWKNEKIINYKFGSIEKWNEFIEEFGIEQY